MCTNLLPDLYGEKVKQLEQIGCEQIASLQTGSVPLADIGDALVVDERYLAALTEDLQTYFLSDSSLDQQRKAIAESFQVHRIKGTVGAIERAFASFDMAASIVEWFDSGKPPYYFDVDISVQDRPITAEIVEKIRLYVGLFKNVRSYLDEVILSYQEQQNIPLKVGGTAEMIATAVSVDSFVCTAAYPIPHTIGGTAEMIATARSIA